MISTKLQSIFIEVTLRHGSSLVNLLHVFRKPFPKTTSGGLLLFSGILSKFNKHIAIRRSLNAAVPYRTGKESNV